MKSDRECLAWIRECLMLVFADGFFVCSARRVSADFAKLEEPQHSPSSICRAAAAADAVPSPHSVGFASSAQILSKLDSERALPDAAAPFSMLGMYRL